MSSRSKKDQRTKELSCSVEHSRHSYSKCPPAKVSNDAKNDITSNATWTDDEATLYLSTLKNMIYIQNN